MAKSSPRSLPWWTWLAPFLIYLISAWLSVLLTGDSSQSWGGWPLAISIAMVLWWGPRALPGILLGVFFASPLYGYITLWPALVNAAAQASIVFIVWVFFCRLNQGKPWLPDIYQLSMFGFIGALPASILWSLSRLWLLSIQPDGVSIDQVVLTTWLGFSICQTALTVPLLSIASGWMEKRAWSQTQGAGFMRILEENRVAHTRIELILFIAIAVSVSVLFPFQKFWVLHSLLLLWSSVRFGFGVTLLTIVLVAVDALILGRVGPDLRVQAVIFPADYLIKILAPTVAALLVGRAMSDQRSEVDMVRSTEQSLHMYGDILTHMPLGLYVFRLEDPEDETSLRLIMLNPASQDNFDGKGAAVIGRRIEDIFPGSGLEGLLSGVARGNAPFSRQIDLAFGHVPPTRATFRINAFPLPNQCAGVILLNISEQQRNAELITSQRDLAQALSQAQNLQEGLNVCLNVAIHVTELDSGGIYLVEPQTQDLILAVHRGLGDEFASSVHRYPPETSNATMLRLGQNRSIILSQDDASIILPQISPEGLTSVLILPLYNQEQLIGCINLSTHCGAKISQFALEALEMIASQMGEWIARLQSEETLRSREQYFRALIEKSSEVIMVANPDRSIRYASPALEVTRGYIPENVIGQDVLANIHPDDRPFLVAQFNRLIEEPHASEEIITRSKDQRGAWRWVKGVVRNLMDDPAVHGIVINYTDITDQKLAEDFVLEAIRKQSDALHAARIVYWEYGVTDDAFLLNDSFYEMVETTAVACGGYSIPADLFFRRFIEEGLSAQMRRAFATAIQTGQPHFEIKLEGQLLRAQSRNIWVETWFRAQKNQQGQTIRLIGVCQDISVRKQEELILAARLRLIQFAESHTLNELLQATLDELSALTGSLIGFYHFLEADQKTLTLQAWSTNTLEKMCTAEGKGSHYNVDEAGVWVDCVRERRALIHNDYANLPHRKGTPEGHAPVIRELVVPVFREGKIVAILGVGNKPNDYDTSDVVLVSRFADLAWDIAARKRAEDELVESEVRYHRIFDAANEGIWGMDQDHHTILVNQKMLDMLGYRAEEMLGRSVEDFMFTEDLHDHQFQMVARHAGQGANYERRFRRKDGSEVWTNVSATVTKNSQGEFTGSFAMFTDITDRHQAEETLAQRNRELAVLVESGHEMTKSLDPLSIYSSLHYFVASAMPCDSLLISTYEPASCLIHCVAGWESGKPLDVSEYPPIPLESEGRGTQSLVIRSGKPLLLNDYERQRSTSATRYYTSDEEIVQEIPDEADRPRSALIVPLMLEGGITGVIQVFSFKKNAYQQGHMHLLEALSIPTATAISNARLYAQAQREIAERKLKEDLLAQSELRFSELVDAAPILVNVAQDRVFVYGNPESLRILKYTHEELIGLPVIAIVHPDDHEQVEARIANIEANQANPPAVIRCLKKGGEIFYLEATSVPIQFNNRPAMLIIGRDISERLRNEIDLRASLAEKNALLKEIHHRVKNNMQVMISLLDLQAQQIADQRMRDLFLESEGRIRSMAMVHEQLYRSTSLSSIDFSAYLERLTWDLYGAFNIQSKVELKVQTVPVSLGIESAIPCGLLVNELITNAFKHAFPGERKGNVLVKLWLDETMIFLTVKDDGIGLPENVQPERSDSLGLKLIQLLTRQLAGTMTIGREGGACFTLEFPAQ